MISINRIADERASLLDWHALEIDFALAKLEVEVTVLFEGFSSAGMSKQSLSSLWMYHSTTGLPGMWKGSGMGLSGS
jgi:hypothetical protein